jgi:RNA polymerase sigma-70 factor (ECF subfamily)
MRFETLFREHYQAVHRYSTRRVGRAAAADAAAEVFLVAWRRRADILPAPGRAGERDRQTLAWLLGVARRVCANQLRSRGRASALGERLAAERGSHIVSLASALTGDGFGPADAVEERLHSALCSLRPDDRELLMMVAWDGLGNREAASLLGCSVGTLAVRLHRARRRLARALVAQREDASERERGGEFGGETAAGQEGVGR